MFGNCKQIDNNNNNNKNFTPVSGLETLYGRNSFPPTEISLVLQRDLTDRASLLSHINRNKYSY